MNNSQTINFGHNQSFLNKKKRCKMLAGITRYGTLQRSPKRTAAAELFLILDQMHGAVIIFSVHEYFIFTGGLRGLTKASGAAA